MRWSCRCHHAPMPGECVISAGTVHLFGIEDAAVNGAAEEHRGVVFVLIRLLDGVGDPGAVLCHLSQGQWMTCSSEWGLVHQARGHRVRVESHYWADLGQSWSSSAVRGPGMGALPSGRLPLSR